MTIAPRLIWLGAPVRPLLPGLPERFVDSLLVPLGNPGRRGGLLRPWETLNSPRSQPAPFWLDGTFGPFLHQQNDRSVWHYEPFCTLSNSHQQDHL
jgi:hypothetical protein